MKSLEDLVYNMIDSKAKTNVAMQGASGLLGWPFTIAADVGVVFTHYGPMLNDIRTLYGRKPVDAESIVPIIRGCSTELLADLVLDKLVGQIPVIGFGANIICAKAMNWRLGILFAMLSSRGEEIDVENVQKAVKLIREVFPQKSSLRFEKPSRNDVHILLRKVANETVASFNETMDFMRKKIASAPTIRLGDL
ncbi:MAG TPA: hypothetical protein IAB31_07165 [Candidatus Choladousia intestinavium]|uniref:Uncharacterized protein n=1 Tax=Candidatus Choladousia intestinavium TaxID=2840727 RepID=A0A9D1ABQ2_9FIRM|nr:hypothetical protein [Candidatus Choladousia intestinavium]